jgi:hypothetical protein
MLERVVGQCMVDLECSTLVRHMEQDERVPWLDREVLCMFQLACSLRACTQDEMARAKINGAMCKCNHESAS